MQVLSLLAAEGAVAGHVAAVDGSPVSGNASRFANLAGDQLAERIAAVEAAIAAEAEAWLAGAAADAQQPLWDGDGDGDEEDHRPGGGDDEGGPSGAGVPRRLAALAAKLARLRAAQDRLTERQAVPGGPAARVAAAQDAVEGAARRLAQAEAAQVSAYDLACRSAYYLTCWFAGGWRSDYGMGGLVSVVRFLSFMRQLGPLMVMTSQWWRKRLSRMAVARTSSVKTWPGVPLKVWRLPHSGFV